MIELILPNRFLDFSEERKIILQSFGKNNLYYYTMGVFSSDYNFLIKEREVYNFYSSLIGKPFQDNILLLDFQEIQVLNLNNPGHIGTYNFGRNLIIFHKDNYEAFKADALDKKIIEEINFL